MVGPILRGIEINPLAAELACTTIWIGHIQWGILELLLRIADANPKEARQKKPIECPDALLKASAEEASCAEAEFVGNPPFLGGKLIRRGLGDEYVDTVFEVFDGRVPPEADLVTYWFEKTRAQIAAGRTEQGASPNQTIPARARERCAQGRFSATSACARPSRSWPRGSCLRFWIIAITTRITELCPARDTGSRQALLAFGLPLIWRVDPRSSDV